MQFMHVSAFSVDPQIFTLVHTSAKVVAILSFLVPTIRHLREIVRYAPVSGVAQTSHPRRRTRPQSSNMAENAPRLAVRFETHGG